MKTIEQAYAERRTVTLEIEKRARAALDDYCKREGFLISGRAKTVDSLRDKIETGRYSNLENVDDIIAFCIVIDKTSQEESVLSFLRSAFNVVSEKIKTTLQDERSFDFDCTRIYARLEDRSKSLDGADKIIFEVQIRTILQHAWSKITHPEVYKAGRFDAKAARLAAELLAQLESIDRSFFDFRENTKNVKLILRREMADCQMIVDMIDELVARGTIPAEFRPKNGRRLGENIYNAIKRDARQDISVPITTIRHFFVAQAGKFPRSISLFQLAIVALQAANQLNVGGRRPMHYYVTDELITLFPEAETIPNRVNVE